MIKKIEFVVEFTGDTPKPIADKISHDLQEIVDTYANAANAVIILGKKMKGDLVGQPPVVSKKKVSDPSASEDLVRQISREYPW